MTKRRITRPVVNGKPTAPELIRRKLTVRKWMTTAEIAKRVKLGPGTVGNALDRMVGFGEVEKDRRDIDGKERNVWRLRKTPPRAKRKPRPKPKKTPAKRKAPEPTPGAPWRLVELQTWVALARDLLRAEAIDPQSRVTMALVYLDRIDDPRSKPVSTRSNSGGTSHG